MSLKCELNDHNHYENDDDFEDNDDGDIADGDQGERLGEQGGKWWTTELTVTKIPGHELWILNWYCLRDLLWKSLPVVA